MISGEIKLSLGTSELQLVRPLGAMLADKTREFICKNGESYMSASKEEIKVALGVCLRAILELNEEKRLKGQSPYEGEFKKAKIPARSMLKLMGIALQVGLAGKEQYSENDDIVRSFLSVSGLSELPQDDPLYKYAVREILKVEQAISQIEQQRNEGLYNSLIEHSILSAYAEPQEPTAFKQEKAQNPSAK